MRSTQLLSLFLMTALAGCVADRGLSEDEVSVGALEGTREGYGVLRLLNDGEGTSFTFLDDDVALERRAAQNLIAHRDGADGIFGTRDDDLFDTIAEVDAVPYVGAAALARLVEFAQWNDYVPGDDQRLGTFDGVAFTYGEADRVLGFVNAASEAELRATGIPSRAVTSILAARPFLTIPTLADAYYVGTRTLELLLEATALPVGGEPCHTSADCTGGLSCVGRPEGFDWGRCRNTMSPVGVQDACDVDGDCNAGLVCIAQTVYERGYCADAWMRDSVEIGGAAGIPAAPTNTSFPFMVFGQASVPEDITLDIDITHSDPSSLWIGLQPPTGQEAVTLWDGATMTGPLPTHYVDRAVYRDDQVNGEWALIIRSEGRGTGRLGTFTFHVTSRWD